MIDRIKFYVDVDFGLVEKHIELVEKHPELKCLNFVKKGEDYSGSVIFEAKIGNIKIKYIGNRLYVEGSLHKAIKGNNYGLFTYDEAKETLSDLITIIVFPDKSISEKSISEKSIVTSIEVGVNMIMDHDSMKYIDVLNNYKAHPFIYQAPLPGTKRLKSRKCYFTEYAIKFYDKTFEASRDKNFVSSTVFPKFVEKEKIPKNILRYELSFKIKKNFYKNFGGKKLTVASLINNKKHYARFVSRLNRILRDIQFNDIYNFAEMSAEDVKRCIFVLSDGYSKYLSYIKEHFGEKEYRKVIRSDKGFLKKISPLKTGIYEKELKDKFAEAISKI